MKMTWRYNTSTYNNSNENLDHTYFQGLWQMFVLNAFDTKYAMWCIIAKTVCEELQ